MRFRDYYEVRDWLESFIPQVWGKEELGLARIEYLLNLLGNPQDKFKSIHIAGTSGKGSTAFYIAKLLQYVGESVSQKIGEPVNQIYRNTDSPKHRFTETPIHRIGLHVSPHLIDIRERMQIFKDKGLRMKDEGLMPMRRFLELFNEIRPVVEKIKIEKPDLTPSYFEILIGASFKYFAEEKVDFAVVEAGLGGRLDATNVLKPEISIITNIGLDHTEILGKTIEKIAFEKAGIIKTKVSKVPKVSEVRIKTKVQKIGVPVVTGTTGKVLKVIKKVAKEKGSRLIKVDTQKVAKELSLKSFSVGQSLAFSGVKELGINVNKSVIRKALSATFPGRFEEIDGGVILDGAHNPDKIGSLINFVRKSKVQSSKFKVKEIILIVAFKKGKNWKKMIDLLIKNLSVKKVMATKFWATTDTGKFGALDPNLIKNYIDKKYSVQSTVAANSQKAVFAALDSAGVNLIHPGGVNVLVTGSLYLVGEVRTMWHLPTFT